MSKSEMLHNLYEECMNIELSEISELIKNAQSEGEKKFINCVIDCILQIKQKAVVNANRF